MTQKVLTAQLRDMEAKGLAHPQGLRRGTAARRIHADRDRLQPKAHPRSMVVWGTHYKQQNAAQEERHDS